MEDKNKISHYLNHISYYHLTPYCKYFQQDTDTFRANVNFENVLNLYIFDKKLRLLLLDLLERIEMSFKCQIAYTPSLYENNPQWFVSPDYFQSQASYDESMLSLLEKIKTSKEEFILHFYKKYSDAYPPAWMFFETISFGECCHVYAKLAAKHKKAIAKTYNLNHNFVETWFRSLSHLRNICAHHARLWNKKFTSRIRQKHHIFKNSFAKSDPQLLYSYLVALAVVMKVCNPKSSWLNQLENIITEHNIEIQKMGFPENWKNLLTNIPTS